jgi:signal transduction histidine kinase/HAMP domain-containing protein
MQPMSRATLESDRQMSLFYLTPASIGYWTQFVLVAITTAYFAYLVGRAWRRGEMPAQMLMFTCFAGSAMCLMVLLFLEVSVHPDWRWQTVFLQDVAVALCLLFLLQFVYRFPSFDAGQKRESYAVLVLSLLYLLWEMWIAVQRFQLLAQGDIKFRPQAADYPMVAGTVWALVTLLRQVVHTSTGEQGQSWWRKLLRPQGRPARSARGVALVSFVFVVASVVDVIPGYLLIYPGTREPLFSLSMLSALFVFVMVYLDYLSQRTSFMAKLAGVSLTIVLAVLGSVGWLMLPPFLADRDRDTLIPNQRTLRFAPNAQGGYDVRAVHSTFDGPIGKAVEPHPSEVYQASLPFPFFFYGQTWRDLYMGEGGWVTVDSALSETSVAVRYGSRPAIFALFTRQLQIDRSDISTNGPSSGIYLDAQTDRFTITWYEMVDQSAPHRRYTFQLVFYPDGAFDVTHGYLASVPAAEIYAGDRSNWVVGAVPGRRRIAPAQVDLADLPYLGAGRDGIVSDPYLRLRGALHQRMLPLLRLIAASSGLVLVGFPVFFFFSLIRPLNALLAGIRQVNAGDLSIEMPVQYHDEVGFLTQSFNGMVAELRGLVSNLEMRVSELQRTENALQRATRQLSFLLEVDRGILAAQLPDAIAQTTVAHVRQLFPCPRADVFMFDFQANESMLLASDLDAETGSVVGTRTPLDLWEDAIEAGRRGQAVVVTGLPSRGRAGESAYAEGIHQFFAVPLIFRGELIGSINLTLDDPETVTPEHEDTLRQVADQLAIAIQQARLYEQVQRHAAELERRVADRTRELSALYEVAAVSSKSSDLHTTLTQSLERVLRAVGCDEGIIYLLDEEGNTLRLAVQQGLSADTVPLVSSLSVRDLEKWGDEYGETVFVPGKVPPAGADVRTVWARRYVGVPMRAGGQVVGLLGVLLKTTQPRFGDEEIALLASVADQVGAVAEGARLRERAEQAAVMEERQRLARDLHDSVTQSLYSLTLLTEGGRRLADSGNLESVGDYFVDLGEIALQSLKEMRLLIHELRPPVLEREGLVGALQRRLDTVEGRAGMEARLMMVGDALEDGGKVDLPVSVEQDLYGIAQEALNNALKHAAATSITVWLRADGGRLELEIVDDGRGFEPERVGDGGGIGLSTMRERSERLNGMLTIQSAPGEGTRVKVSIKTHENP